jgi:para-aminobenzoate synthetase component 1
MEQQVFYLPQHRLGPLLGLGVHAAFTCEETVKIADFQAFLNAQQGQYIFGTISYDYKNSLEALTSDNPDECRYPLLHFWVPKSIFILTEKPQHLAGENNISDQEAAQHFWEKLQHPEASIQAQFKERTTKATYFDRFAQIRKALQQGDIYELNYCQEFYAEQITIEQPVQLFAHLTQLTQAPHAAYIQTPSHFVFCASPERFLEKRGELLRSEPIKGTAPRHPDAQTDEANAKQLKNDPKERAENIMIVDLVRNDLSQLAQKGTVAVDELCEIYSFATVHQMISKISCVLKPNTSFTDILKHTFPMGSMTGAPKISAIQHIERLEDFKRGLYSGSIGLIEPNGDFDFNVVIRSLIYNRNTNYLSCSVGSAVTIDAAAEKEYQECLLKANKLIYGLQS